MLRSELVPAAEKNSRRLMVMLHGLGDSIEGFSKGVLLPELIAALDSRNPIVSM